MTEQKGPASTRIVVLGASGNVGRETIKCLSQRVSPDFEVVAGYRDPEKVHHLMACCKDKGVQFHQMDFEKIDTIRGILKKNDLVFMVVPNHEHRDKLANQVCDIAKQIGVGYLLTVSISTAELKETVFGRQFAEIETHIKQSGLPCTFLRLPYFMDNFKYYAHQIRDENCLLGPLRDSARYCPVSVEDAGKFAATILSKPNNLKEHFGKVYNINMTPFSTNEFLCCLGKKIGKELKYKQIDFNEMKKCLTEQCHVPSWSATGIIEVMKKMDEGWGVFGHHTCDFKHVVGEETMEMKDWVEKNAGLFKHSTSQSC